MRFTEDIQVFRVCWRYCLPALLLLFLSGMPFNLFSQNEFFKTDFQANDAKTRADVLNEKVYVHSDKSFYMAGEMMWFKIYAVDGGNNHPMIMDKFAYIELLDNSDNAVLHCKIPMADGMGNGSFFIPLSLNTGNYTLRAYTNWMKNFDPGGFFEKAITLFNPLKRISVKVPKEKHIYSIGFYPEGGNLVESLESIVGVKVTDQFGKGVEFNGWLLDQNKDTVVSFKPFRFGMGKFKLRPLKTYSYQATIILPDTLIRVALPDIYKEGYVMHSEDTANQQIKITVRANTGFSLPLYLVAQTGKKVKLGQTGLLAHGEAIFFIDRNQLGEGFSVFTLFDGNKEAVCERLYFKKPAGLNISLSLEKHAQGIRQKLGIGYQVRYGDGRPADANLSATVYLVDALQPVEEINIVNYLWLSSELRGTIESPGSYFQDDQAGVEEALENLTLTQGWRRFNPAYKSSGERITFKYAPEFEGQVINAKVLNKNSGLPVPDISAWLSVPGKNFQLAHSRSNAEGELVFVLPVMHGENVMIAQIADNKGNEYRMEMTDPFSDAFAKRQRPPFVYSPRLQEIYESRSVATQVQNIYYPDSLQKIWSAPVKDSNAFYGRPDKKYYLDNYTRFNSMEEVFREYVQDVILRKLQDKFYLRVLNKPRNLYFDGAPLTMVDGVPVMNVDSIIAFDPLKVYKMEIVSGKYILGSDELKGIVSLSTYSGDLAGFPLDPNAIVLEDSYGSPQGRQYYSPVYDGHEKPGRLPDFRNLLYWSPDIRTGKTGSGFLNFYTSEQKGRYAVVIQGMAKGGETGYGIGFFEVGE